ncbi:hypothetical protein [Antarctobacter jejuensis]|uniref:hypothetical protein n=1 Tax=Antarctobacter jejuensis TaxID=1439938 RepID=UPI003FCF8832
MTAPFRHRGGAPVGQITDLPPVEAEAVLYLRLWCDSVETKQQVWNDFARTLGTGDGRRALESFESLCELCARHGRRPLMRHQVTCKCLGADESCFATLIGYASEGAREDAMLMAMTLVRPDMAGVLAGLAEEVALALRRMTLKTGRDSHAAPAMTLH